MNIAGEHQGKLLISITNGEKLGEVKDMYFDSELTKLTAVLASSEGGLFSRKAIAHSVTVDVGSKDIPMLTVLANTEAAAV